MISSFIWPLFSFHSQHSSYTDMFFSLSQTLSPYHSKFFISYFLLLKNFPNLFHTWFHIHNLAQRGLPWSSNLPLLPQLSLLSIPVSCLIFLMAFNVIWNYLYFYSFIFGLLLSPLQYILSKDRNLVYLFIFCS